MSNLQANLSETKPYLIYDGECGFCKLCVNLLKEGATLNYEESSYQDWLGTEKAKNWDLNETHFSKAVYLLLPEGKHLSGAEAIYWLLHHSNKISIFYKIYKFFPPYKILSDLGYGLVAKNRFLASKGLKTLQGLSDIGHRRNSTIELFFILLSICHVFFFVSMLMEGQSLFGVNGIASIKSKIIPYTKYFNDSRIWNIPSLFWMNQSNGFIDGLSIAGLLSSVGILIKKTRFFSLIINFLFILSFLGFGQPFLNFQWDSLLLETTFLSLLILSPKGYSRHSGFGLLALWSLSVKLFVSSGAVKLLSSTPHWKNGTALLQHFQTQPLANNLSIYFHSLPVWILMTSTLIVVFMQIFFPLFQLVPGKFRKWSTSGLIILQLFIFLSGNYNFFNINAIALLILFYRDEDLKFIPLSFNKRLPIKEIINEKLKSYFGIFIIIVNLLMITDRVGGTSFSPYGSSWNQSLRIFNHYGLFANMTMYRDELILEYSQDKNSWSRIDFPYKPDFEKDCPTQIAPIQPRLDWQMWFAALGSIERNRWLQSLVVKILKGQKTGFSFLEKGDYPPKYLRIRRVQFNFNNLSEYLKGNCWKESYKSDYIQEISIENIKR